MNKKCVDRGLPKYVKPLVMEAQYCSLPSKQCCGWQSERCNYQALRKIPIRQRESSTMQFRTSTWVAVCCSEVHTFLKGVLCDFSFFGTTVVGWDREVGIATTLMAGRSGDRNPMVVRFSAPAQTYPGVHHTPLSRGEVTGRVELYFCSQSGASRSVLGWLLPFAFGVNLTNLSGIQKEM